MEVAENAVRTEDWQPPRLQEAATQTDEVKAGAHNIELQSAAKKLDQALTEALHSRATTVDENKVTMRRLVLDAIAALETLAMRHHSTGDELEGAGTAPSEVAVREGAAEHAGDDACSLPEAGDLERLIAQV